MAASLLDGDVVRTWLTGVIRPRLDAAAVRLRARLPELTVRTNAGDVGSRTEFQGCRVYLNAIVPAAQDADVALEVTGAYLTTTPRVFADVCWGHPYGTSEAALIDAWSTSTNWPLATADLLARVEAELPRLIEAFASAAERGRPND